MADVTNCRMFLLGRYYYDFKHKLIVEHGRLVKDTHYDYNDQIIGVSYFEYVTDTPNYKKIIERMGHSSIQVTLDKYGHLMPELYEIGGNAMNDVVI